MRQDLMLRAYKAAEGMEPIALLDDYVRIIGYKTTIYRKVDFYEAIPPFQCIDFQAAAPAGPLAVAAALAANTTGAQAQLTNLDLQDDEFGQWRWFPLDVAQIQLFLPNGVAKWQLKNLQVGVDKSIIYRDPLLISTEFNSWQDERPSMRPINYTGYAKTAIRIITLGFRFHTTNKFDGVSAESPESKDILKRLEAGQLPCTPIQCSGHA